MRAAHEILARINLELLIEYPYFCFFLLCLLMLYFVFIGYFLTLSIKIYFYL